MNNVLENIRTQLKEYFTALSKQERKRLVILVVVILALAILAAVLLGRTSYAVIFTGEPQEAGEVLAYLTDQGVDVRTEGVGTLLVPEDQVSSLRMQLSTAGITSNDYRYDIFVEGTGFGTTDRERVAYYQFQLAQHISTTLNAMSKVDSSFVMVNLANISSYVRQEDNQPASATVMLSLKGGNKLTREEVNSVASVVMGAVQGIKKENIHITDNMMNSYSTTETDILESDNVTNHLGLTTSVRENLESQVLNLLSPVFGMNNVRPAVHVELNFDTEIVNSVEFAPPVEGETQGLILSVHQLWEATREEGIAEGIPGTDSNGMGVVEYPYGELEDGTDYYHWVQDINYELNETRTQLEKAKGGIKNISVSVVLNSDAVTEDYTETVSDLVATAIGVDPTYITVSSLPFKEDTSITSYIEDQQREMFWMQIKDLIYTLLKLAVVVVLALMVYNLIKLLIRSRSESERLQDEALHGIDVLAGFGDDELLDSVYKDIDLNAKSEAVEQLEKFIDKDPQAVAQLLRNWLLDEM